MKQKQIMKRVFKILLMLLLVTGFSFGITSCKTKENTPIISDGNGNGNGNGENDVFDEAALLNLSIRDYKGKNGVVAAANPYAAKAGLDILKMGGNAFDAAVAVSFALGVVEPNASGIGGGGIMVAYNATEGRYVSYNFREFAPALGSADIYRNPKYPDEEDFSRWGIKSSGVPTQVVGLLKALEDNGVLTRQQVMAPAIKYADEGVKVTPELANAIRDQVAKLLISKSEIAGVFSDELGIEFIKEGELLVQKDYAKALRLISEQGAEGFYKGELADALVALQEAEGGLITHDDLTYAMENYPYLEEPVVGTYRGYDIVSATTPSSGGITLIEVLNMLEQYGDISALGHNSVEYLHVLATAQTLAYADKREFVGDSRMVNVPIKGLTSKEYAAERWKLFDPTKAHLGRYGSQTGASDAGNPWKYEPKIETYLFDNYVTSDNVESASTTSFSVADKDGNIVSVTQTINYFFGNGYVVPGFGFFMNNELSSFNVTNSGHINYAMGLKQPVSHIMPTIIMKDGDPFLTIGSPGSMRIPAAVIQVVINMIDFDMDIQSAIAAPRIFSYAMASANFGIAGRQSGSYLKDVYIEKALAHHKEALEALGYYVIIQGDDDIDLFFGGAQGIHFDRNQENPLHGGADPRRDGKALGY